MRTLVVSCVYSSSNALVEELYALNEAIVLGMTEGRHGPEAFRDAYVKHNKRIQEIVPPERLLLWGPQDGWGPLCKFLGKSIPEVPVPYVNESKQWTNHRKESMVLELRYIIKKIVMGLGLAVGSVIVIKKYRLIGYTRNFLLSTWEAYF